MVTVRAASRLRENVVNHTEFFKVFGAELEGFGRFGGFGTVLPKNRCAAFRGDD